MIDTEGLQKQMAGRSAPGVDKHAVLALIALIERLDALIERLDAMTADVDGSGSRMALRTFDAGR